MNRLRRQILAAAPWAVASPFAWTAESASSFPSRPIRFVVPYPPGGSADILGRLVQVRLQEKLGQPVVVETKTGVGGNLGTDFVAKSPADGYTILLAGGGPMAVAKALYREKLTYDPERDLRGVIQLAEFPMVLVANPKVVDARTPAAFLEWVRSGPDTRRTFASAGNGTPQHLCMAYFAKRFGLNLTHVPYRGSAPAVLAVAAGEVPFEIEVVTSALPQIQAGGLRPLAVTTARRAETLPDVPTLAETIAEGFDFGTWSGIACPRGVPDPIVQKLNRAIQEILAEPAIVAKWREVGARVAGGSASDFDRFLRSETERLGGLVTELGLTA